jgi:hypothetical protein
MAEIEINKIHPRTCVWRDFGNRLLYNPKYNVTKQSFCCSSDRFYHTEDTILAHHGRTTG